MKRTVLVGIVGCGRMGRERAAQLQSLGIPVTAFVDNCLEKALELAARVPSSVAATSLSDERIRRLDAIFVCTPPADRRAPVLAAMRWRSALFLEKPIAATLVEAAWLRDTIVRGSLLNAVGYMNRYRPGAVRARELARTSGVLGIACRWAGRRYDVPWWGDEALSGGPINEQATHLIDLCRYIGGEVVDMQTRVSNGGESAGAVFSFRSGALGTLLYTCRAPEKDIGFHLFTLRGSLHLDGWDFSLTRDVCDIAGASAVENPFEAETRAFIEAIESGENTGILSDVNDAYETQLLVARFNQAEIEKHEVEAAIR
jgi:myo-inositol 2-dehydrogenase/D-chiro-inositol 1-dehydrogenase